MGTIKLTREKRETGLEKRECSPLRNECSYDTVLCVCVSPFLVITVIVVVVVVIVYPKVVYSSR